MTQENVEKPNIWIKIGTRTKKCGCKMAPKRNHLIMALKNKNFPKRKLFQKNFT